MLVLSDHCLYFFHLNYGLAFSQIVLFYVFMNRYLKYEEDLVYRVSKFELAGML